MNRLYLVPVAVLLASAAASAQPPGPQPQGSQAAVEKPREPAQPVATRQLSPQELADLRKLLSQNSRHSGKGS